MVHQQTRPIFGLPTPVWHLLIVAIIFLGLLIWMYQSNYRLSSWYDDEIMFAHIASVRNAQPISAALVQNLSDVWEIYAPFITIPMSIIWKLAGNDSALLKLSFSTLMFVNALLFYGLLCQVVKTSALRLIGALLFLTAPVLIETYSWSITIQHSLTAACALCLINVLIMAARSKTWQGLIGFSLIADLVAFIGGFGREPMAVVAVAILVCSPLYSELRFKRMAMIAYPALFVLPQQFYNFVASRSGYQVRLIFDYDLLSYDSIILRYLRTIDINGPWTYALLLLTQVVILLIAIATDADSKPRLSIAEWAANAIVSAGIALVTLFGSMRVGLILLSVIPFGSLVVHPHLADRWVDLTAPYVLMGGSILCATGYWVWRRLPPIVLASVFLCECAVMLYFGANSLNFRRFHDHDIYIYSRYSIYVLPVAILIIMMIAESLGTERTSKVIAIVLYLGVAINIYELGSDIAHRASILPVRYSPARFDLPDCKQSVFDWSEIMRGVNLMLKSFKIAPFTYDMIGSDQTVRRWLEAPYTERSESRAALFACLGKLRQLRPERTD